MLRVLDSSEPPIERAEDFQARHRSKKIVTRYGEILCEDEREQNKKPKDIDLVLGISPISYHMCHIRVHSRFTILHRDTETSIHRAHR